MVRRVFKAVRQVYVINCPTDYQNFSCRSIIHDRVSAHGVAISAIPRRYLAARSIGAIPIHSFARSCLEDRCTLPSKEHSLQHL